ncbi:MAG: hypothetical protein EGP10_02500 [SAR202 cluster bacterium]|nr:MAG: hypothetical protein EGP10_02500 [SAR202 cluster bacterium]|tara:strand:- start:2006 stop:2386 length:381 start_codon:yes stop_codon:yes gene_type:complete
MICLAFISVNGEVMSQSNEKYLESLNQLTDILERLCLSIDPFPGFMGMQTIKAIELDPIDNNSDIGCIVVTPEGKICELQLNLIPGPAELGGYEQDEKFNEIDLSTSERFVYISRAIEEVSKFIFK